jgi:phenylacetate-CoA ligase
LHGWEDHFLFEVIDQDTLQPVPYGQPGELVITTLTKEALPMIRYRTRDISTINPERCACGRTHVRLSRISGRNDDMLIIRGVNVFPSQIEAVMVGRHGVSPHYRLLAQKDGVMDTLTVEVEAEPEIVKSQDAYDNLARGVQHHIKTMVGITCRVVVLSPGEIPRSVGKAVRVFDERLQQIVVR